jgi:hypothetical protein
MRPGGNPWTIGAALALGVGGCGGGDAAPDAATFYTWLLLVDAAAGSVRFPEIPADLPQPSPLFDGELEVYCFRGTHLEGHLRPLDLDELPLGEVEYGGWVTYHDLL